MKEHLLIGHTANGIYCVDMKVTENGFAKSYACISKDRSIEWRTTELSEEAKQYIQDIAFFENRYISVYNHPVLNPSFEDIYYDRFQVFKPREVITERSGRRSFIYKRMFQTNSIETYPDDVLERLKVKTADFVKLQFTNELIEYWSESLRVCLYSNNFEITVGYFDNNVDYLAALNKSTVLYNHK